MHDSNTIKVQVRTLGLVFLASEMRSLTFSSRMPSASSDIAPQPEDSRSFSALGSSTIYICMQIYMYREIFS